MELFKCHRKCQKTKECAENSSAHQASDGEHDSAIKKMQEMVFEAANGCPLSIHGAVIVMVTRKQFESIVQNCSNGCGL